MANHSRDPIFQNWQPAKALTPALLLQQVTWQVEAGRRQGLRHAGCAMSVQKNPLLAARKNAMQK